METLDYNSFAAACVEELKILQYNFQNEYDVDWYDNWFYNQSTGLLTFSTGDQELNFKYFDVGSFSEKSNTWKWSWDNDSTLDNVKENATTVKEFGQRLNFSKLITGYFISDEFEAWEFVAIAAKLTNGIGGSFHLNIHYFLSEAYKSHCNINEGGPQIRWYYSSRMNRFAGYQNCTIEVWNALMHYKADAFQVLE